MGITEINLGRVVGYNGTNGINGKTAYEYAVDGGFNGSEQDFSDALSNAASASSAMGLRHKVTTFTSNGIFNPDPNTKWIRAIVVSGGVGAIGHIEESQSFQTQIYKPGISGAYGEKIFISNFSNVEVKVGNLSSAIRLNKDSTHATENIQTSGDSSFGDLKAKGSYRKIVGVAVNELTLGTVENADVYNNAYLGEGGYLGYGKGGIASEIAYYHASAIAGRTGFVSAQPSDGTKGVVIVEEYK